MLKTSLAALTVLLLATSAHAEEPTPWFTPAPTAVPAPPPGAETAPVVASEATPPPPLGSARLPPAFMDRFLSYDDDAEVVRQGRARQPLSPDALYAQLNRPDLVEKSRAAVRRRVIFGVAAGVAFVAGATTVVLSRLGGPNLNAGPCVQNIGTYNRICVPDEQRRDILSAVGVVGGLSLTALLGTLAYWSSPDVLSRDEKTSLISQHNGSLLKRLRNESADVRFTPYASPQGAGVVTSFTF